MRKSFKNHNNEILIHAKEENIIDLYKVQSLVVRLPINMAGRVFQGVPAPTNLVVPEHSFPTEDTLLVGVAPGEA